MNATETHEEIRARAVTRLMSETTSILVDEDGEWGYIQAGRLNVEGVNMSRKVSAHMRVETERCDKRGCTAGQKPV